MFTFKVKIVKNTRPGSWYKDLVGSVRKVKFHTVRTQSIIEKIFKGLHLEDIEESTPGCGYIIMYRDCIPYFGKELTKTPRRTKNNRRRQKRLFKSRSKFLTKDFENYLKTEINKAFSPWNEST